MRRFFIGIDLSAPSGSSGVCVVEKGKVLFLEKIPFFELLSFLEDWRGKGKLTVAIDGPQGLSGERGRYRIADSLLNTPVKCGYDFPSPPNPYAEFVKGSISLFYSLHRGGFTLFGSTRLKDFEVIETYPNKVWEYLSSGGLPPKTLKDGRERRLWILKKFGIVMKEPSDHDLIDAGGCVLTALSAAGGRYISFGVDFFDDGKVLREGWVLLPFVKNR